MTDKEIFYKILNKSFLNGYTISKYVEALMKITNCELFDFKDLIIYSKNFAKAVFGNEDNVYSNKAWVHRLHEMSLEEDEFKFLEKFL